MRHLRGRAHRADLIRRRHGQQVPLQIGDARTGRPPGGAVDPAPDGRAGCRAVPQLPSRRRRRPLERRSPIRSSPTASRTSSAGSPCRSPAAARANPKGSSRSAAGSTDIRAAIDHMAGRPGVTGVWAAGFGTGGALCLCAGAADTRVRGVAVLGAPADFDDWGGQPRRLLEHARDVGLVTDRSLPGLVRGLGPRPASHPAARLRREVHATVAARGARHRRRSGSGLRRARDRRRARLRGDAHPRGSEPPVARRPASRRGAARLARSRAPRIVTD